MTEGQIALPAGISGIRFSELVHYAERGLVAVERGRKVALFQEHIADLVMCDGEGVLPTGVFRIGLGESLSTRHTRDMKN
jgi:hypothetical protein